MSNWLERFQRISYWVIGGRFQKLTKGTRLTFLTGLVLLISVFLISLFADFLTLRSPYTMFDGAVLRSPSLEFLLGTDNLGRDILSRSIFGLRLSMFIGFTATIFSASIGSVLGVMSGYRGGIIDKVLTLPMDVLVALPGFLIALVISIFLTPSIENTALAIGLGGVPTYFRTVRSLAISLKEELFVESEIGLGASDLYIVFRHIFPLCFSVIIVLMTIGIAHSIVVAATLGFLGFGVPPPLPELGADLAQGRIAITLGIWWTTLVPSFFIFVLIISFNLVGEGLNRALGTTLEEI